MKVYLFSAFAALLALAPMAEASAKSIKIQASGTVSSGSDGAGLFGAGSNLAGQAFSYEVTFDLTNAYYFNLGFRTDLLGGDSYDYLPGAPPSLAVGDAVFKLNGVAHAIHANWNTTLTAFAGGFDQQYIQERVQTGGDLFAQQVLLQEQPGFGTFGPDYMPPAGNLCTGPHVCDSSNFSYETFIGGVFTQTFAQLNPSSVTITEVGTAVPEPTTWALTIAGFALTGGALRSRRRRALA
jgi:hypothetical protein